MGELLKNIAGGVDLPKRLFDNAELLLKKLLGSAVDETGGMLGDAIRSRRFKNQINIFSKAQELLRNKGIEPKQINLKLLVPLIEYSSLEEDEVIQNKWANMIANIATEANVDSFNKKCISILNELSEREVLLLDKVYDEYANDDFLSYKGLSMADLKFEGQFDDDVINIVTDRLSSYGLLQGVIIQTPRFGSFLLSDPSLYKLTKFGIYFIELCKFDK